MNKIGIDKSIMPAFRLFQGNYNELIKALVFYEDSPEVTHLWISANKSEWLYIIEEIARLLNNFATSAIALVDQYHKQVNELTNIAEYSSFLEEYKEEIDRVFLLSENHQLIQGLSNYFLHADIAAVLRKWSWNRDKGEERIIMIEIIPLLDWDGWKPLVQKILSQSQNGIAIRQVIEEYYKDVATFYRWTWQKQTEFLQTHILHINNNGVSFSPSKKDPAN